MSQPEDNAAQADTATSEAATEAPVEPTVAESTELDGAPAESTEQPAVRPPSAGAPQLHKVRRTRFSVLWTTVIIAALVLILLLIFILQNNNSVQIEFLGASGKLPLGVAMLFAAVAGVLLVAIPGYGRILQLRRAVRKAGHRAK